MGMMWYIRVGKEGTGRICEPTWSSFPLTRSDLRLFFDPDSGLLCFFLLLLSLLCFVSRFRSHLPQKMIETPSFSTSRLVFRSPEPADFEQPNGFLWNLYNDESVQHGLTANSVRPQTKEQVEKWFKQLSETAALDCIFCVKDGGDAEKKATKDLEPAGWLTIDKINNLHQKATFGLAISPKHQVSSTVPPAFDV